MNKVKIEIEVPEALLEYIDVKEISDRIKRVIAIDLYSKQKLSLENSSELANLNKSDFISLLSRCEYILFNGDSGEHKTVDKL